MYKPSALQRSLAQPTCSSTNLSTCISKKRKFGLGQTVFFYVLTIISIFLTPKPVMAFTSLGSRIPEQPELKTDCALKLLDVQVNGSSLSALESLKNRHILCSANVRGNHSKSNKLLDVSTRRLFLCSLGVIIGTFVHDHDRAEAYENNSKQNVYPGGNNVKSLQSMGGLPKKIRSICVIMVCKEFSCLYL